MTERPDFIDSTDPQESVFSRGGQSTPPQEPHPVTDEDDLPATVPAPRQGPVASPGGDPTVPPAASATGAASAASAPSANPYAVPPTQPRTAQPFPNASNYRNPGDPAAQQPAAGPGSPTAPQGNYWQPQQAASAEFQATQGHTAQAGAYYGQQNPGYAQGAGYAQPQGLPVVQQPAATGPYYDLGPILIRGDRVITPSGTIPLTQAQFSFQDMSQTTKRTPTWAIVVAIVLCWFFLLSLLLLLVQEEQTTGQVIVSVTGGEGAYYLTVPVTSQAQTWAWAQQVQQAQMIASQAHM